MPWGLKRYQQTRALHFITFSCYRRQAFLDTAKARASFESELERARKWYGFFVTGYVVMPEHVHLLISEPERGKLSVALQMLKQIVSRKLRRPGERRFWQVRYYDFPVWSAKKLVEKLRYIHRNPVKRGLVAHPEDWQWSSFRQWLTGCEGRVEIESQWTSRKREGMGIKLIVASQKVPALRQNRAKGRGILMSDYLSERVGQPPARPRTLIKELRVYDISYPYQRSFANQSGPYGNPFHF